MLNLTRSEIRKYFTTRMAWGMPLAMFLTGALFAVITGLFIGLGEIEIGDNSVNLRDVLPDLTAARMVYTGAVQMGYLLALVLGILSMGQEFRHKTITGTFLAGPRRTQVVLAKVAGLGVVVTVNAVAHLAGVLIGGAIVLTTQGFPWFPEPGQLVRTLLLLILVLVLWGLFGLGLGVLIPNQIAALFTGVAMAWILEPLLGWGLSYLDGGEQVARFFPSQATTATLSVFSGADINITQSMGGSPDQLSWWGGALTLLTYAAVMTFVGIWLTRRRDIS